MNASRSTVRAFNFTEVNLAAEDFVSRAAALLDRGLLITVDYGAERDELLAAPHRSNGTLRSFRRHQMVDNVFANPGQQDLTTTIDWTQIMAAGEHSRLEVLRFEPLDHFLSSEGLLAALSEMVTTTNDPVEAVRLSTSAREMIVPGGMAASFQVLVQRKC
jgi:SAM-dependent MidA family methyltransferase